MSNLKRLIFIANTKINYHHSVGDILNAKADISFKNCLPEDSSTYFKINLDIFKKDGEG